MDQPVRYKHSANVHNLQAAEAMVPRVMELFNPVSVADVGCGLGSWLHVFQKAGVKRVAGFDGDYVDKSRMYISPEDFFSADLEKPLPVNAVFDLALCLEVAEHLKEASAHVLVSSLVKLSDTIIFSAAIPGQGGQNHINEQWPEWWARHFRKHDFYFYDIFREQFWQDARVDWWYRQNIFLVTTQEKAEKLGFRKGENSYIHPELYMQKLRKINEYQSGLVSVGTAASVLTKAVKRALKKRLGGKP